MVVLRNLVKPSRQAQSVGLHHLRRNRFQAHSCVANLFGLGDEALETLVIRFIDAKFANFASGGA